MNQLNLLNHIDKINPPKVTEEVKRKRRNIKQMQELYLQS